MEALNELESFSYQPGRPEAAVEEEQPRKRARPSAQQQAAELLAQAERDLVSSQVEVTQLDANSLKRMILSVEKRINENMQLRMKYAEQPDKFMDSELELYQVHAMPPPSSESDGAVHSRPAHQYECVAGDQSAPLHRRRAGALWCLREDEVCCLATRLACSRER